MTDQAREGILSPFLRAQRLKAAKRLLDGKVLDYGCGSGALCEFVPADLYLGVDLDRDSIDRARKLYPQHHFETTDEPSESGFDVVVSLAVIEHVPDPAKFLKKLSRYRVESRDATVVCSTPNPVFEPLYNLGARVGLFSHSAEEEHETLLDQRSLRAIAKEAGLDMLDYRKFLFGANQIAVFGNR